MAEGSVSTSEVVERYFRSVNSGDWENWLSLFARDAVVIEPIGTIEGLDSLREAVEVLKKVYSSFQNNLINYFVDGEQASAQTHISAITASGKPVEVDVCNIYIIKNGKIVHQKNYLDARSLQPFLDELKKQGY
jgi:ketosteroid isomerase-like protein